MIRPHIYSRVKRYRATQNVADYETAASERPASEQEALGHSIEPPTVRRGLSQSTFEPAGDGRRDRVPDQGSEGVGNDGLGLPASR